MLPELYRTPGRIAELLSLVGVDFPAYSAYTGTTNQQKGPIMANLTKSEALNRIADILLEKHPDNVRVMLIAAVLVAAKVMRLKG